MFWQLAINAKDPPRLARFWAEALGYQPFPPDGPHSTWNSHYRSRLGGSVEFDDRIFDPAGHGPPLWFQKATEPKSGTNRLHLDLYPTGRDDSLSLEQRIAIVEARVTQLEDLGAAVQRRTSTDEPTDTCYYVVMHDPEGNEFCVS